MSSTRFLKNDAAATMVVVLCGSSVVGFLSRKCSLFCFLTRAESFAAVSPPPALDMVFVFVSCVFVVKSIGA